MGTSSERIFNGSGKGYLPAGTIGNRTHILSERLKAGTEFKRLKKGHRPAPMPPTWTHILSYKPEIVQRLEREMADRAAAVEKVDAFKNQLARAIKAFMVTSSERVFNGSGKGYPPAGTIGNRTHILSERLKAGTEFKRLKKEHRPAPMPLK